MFCNKKQTICAVIILNAFLLISISIAKELQIPEEIEIGEHQMGEVVEAEFLVSNISSQAITIKNIIASCGCIKIKPTDMTILPRKKGKITINIDSFGIEGEFNKSITLVNTSTVPLYTTRILGKFIAKDHNIVVFPPALGMAKVNHAKKYQQVFTVKRRGNVPIGKIQIEVPKGCRHKVLSERSTDERIYFVFTTDTLLPGNHLIDNIYVHGNSEDDFARIPISIQTRSVLEIFPDTILVSPKKDLYEIDLLFSNKEVPELLSYQFQSDELKLDSVQIKHGNDPKLLIKVSRLPGRMAYCRGKLCLQFKKCPPVNVNLISPPLK